MIRAWLADAVAQRAPRRTQRHAPLQQPGPLDADGPAGGGELLDDAGHDVWAVNVEDEYHEIVVDGDVPAGTGRTAPVLPSRPSSTG